MPDRALSPGMRIYNDCELTSGEMVMGTACTRKGMLKRGWC